MLGLIINTPWGGAEFALGTYLITLVIVLLVVGIIKLMFGIIHFTHRPTADNKSSNKPEEGKQ